MNRYARRRGFTLVEVLVALVIVTFGMGAVLAALSSAADSTARLREKTLAEWIGFNQLSTVRLALTAPAAGSSSGKVEFADSNWRWRQTIEESEAPGVRRITVRVRHVSETDADDADADWLATTIGFRGDAVNAASGEQPDWNGTGSTSGTGGGSQGTGSGSNDSPSPSPEPEQSGNGAQ